MPRPVEPVLASGSHLLPGAELAGRQPRRHLARVRQQQRPRYGFYVDHIVDSFGGLALMGGLALSGYMHPYIAIGLLVAFLLLSSSLSGDLHAGRISALVLELWPD